MPGILAMSSLQSLFARWACALWNMACETQVVSQHGHGAARRWRASKAMVQPWPVPWISRAASVWAAGHWAPWASRREAASRKNLSPLPEKPMVQSDPSPKPNRRLAAKGSRLESLKWPRWGLPPGSWESLSSWTEVAATQKWEFQVYLAY